MSDASLLTEREAYEAMFVFLDAYWVRGDKQSDDIASLLGHMAIMSDEQTLDPAQWHDWREAVAQIRDGKRPFD